MGFEFWQKKSRLAQVELYVIKRERERDLRECSILRSANSVMTNEDSQIVLDSCVVNNWSLAPVFTYYTLAINQGITEK